jgi:hypothetical protein
MAGCANQKNFLSGSPTVGQLKTSLSHVEYENSQLRRELAKVQQENRSMEDRLVQQEVDNGELAARLDDARNLLHDRGFDLNASLPSGGRPSSESSENRGSGIRTLPAGQSSRKGRKPPVARIPGRVEVDPPVNEDDLGSSSESTSQLDNSSQRLGEDLDHHSFYSGPLRWLPVAEGPANPSLQVR